MGTFLGIHTTETTLWRSEQTPMRAAALEKIRLARDAQLGAFLIAHRIRRPLPIELTGMLDSYRKHGPRLETPGRRALCFGVPYDGRNRTAPLLPLIALVLASSGLPVVLHGGDPMPVKFGITLAELFAALGIEWRGLSLGTLQQRLNDHNLALSREPGLGSPDRRRRNGRSHRQGAGRSHGSTHLTRRHRGPAAPGLRAGTDPAAPPRSRPAP
jgi:hypothetical protein